jgi:hypothetical protein
MIDKKPKQLVVDLSRVAYIDSAGLAALIEGMQKVEAYGGQFALADLRKTVRSIFEIARLIRYFGSFRLDAALAASNQNLQHAGTFIEYRTALRADRLSILWRHAAPHPTKLKGHATPSGHS